MRFSIFYKSTSGACFSESARKMTQNGGRIVAIGSIFDMNVKAVSSELINLRSATSSKIGKFYGPRISDDFVALFFLEWLV